MVPIFHLLLAFKSAFKKIQKVFRMLAFFIIHLHYLYFLQFFNYLFLEFALNSIIFLLRIHFLFLINLHFNSK